MPTCRLQGATVVHDDDNVFVAAFQGVLCLFLLEMGMTASRRLKDLKSAGPGFIAFGLLAPNLFAALGIIATALTAGYSLMALKKMFFGSLSSDNSNVKEAPWTITLPLILLSIVTIFLGIYPEPILGRLLSAAKAIVGA